MDFSNTLTIILNCVGTFVITIIGIMIKQLLVNINTLRASQDKSNDVLGEIHAALAKTNANHELLAEKTNANYSILTDKIGHLSNQVGNLASDVKSHDRLITQILTKVGIA